MGVLQKWPQTYVSPKLGRRTHCELDMCHMYAETCEHWVTFAQPYRCVQEEAVRELQQNVTDSQVFSSNALTPFNLKRNQEGCFMCVPLCYTEQTGVCVPFLQHAANQYGCHIISTFECTAST